MSERRVDIHLKHELPRTRRCELLEVARSTAYYRPAPVREGDLVLMRLIDEIHLQRPFYGSRRIRDELEKLPDAGQILLRLVGKLTRWDGFEQCENFAVVALVVSQLRLLESLFYRNLGSVSNSGNLL